MATAALPCLGQGRTDFLGIVVVVVVEVGIVVVVEADVVVVVTDEATAGATRSIDTATSPTRDAAGKGARRNHRRGDAFTSRFYVAHKLRSAS